MKTVHLLIFGGLLAAGAGVWFFMRRRAAGEPGAQHAGAPGQTLAVAEVLQKEGAPIAPPPQVRPAARAAAPAKKKGKTAFVTGLAKKVVRNKLVKGAAVTAASVYGTPAAGAAVGMAMNRV